MLFFIHMLDRYSNRVFTKTIREGERIIKVFRPHPVRHVFGFSCTLIFFLLPLIFLRKLLAWEILGFVIFLSAYFFGIALLLRIFYTFRLHAFLVTDERLIDFDQRGFFYRTVSECRFDKISDVRYTTKGLRQALFGLGDVMVSMVGEDFVLEINNISHPHKVQQFILDRQADFLRESQSEANSTEFLFAARKTRRDSF